MERVIDGTGKNTVWHMWEARQSFRTGLVVFQHSDYHTVLLYRQRFGKIM